MISLGNVQIGKVRYSKGYFVVIFTYFSGGLFRSSKTCILFHFLYHKILVLYSFYYSNTYCTNNWWYIRWHILNISLDTLVIETSNITTIALLCFSHSITSFRLWSFQELLAWQGYSIAQKWTHHNNTIK